MKKGLFLTGILAMVLVFGTMVVGCANPKLNGTWELEDSSLGTVYKFKNGKYEVSFGSLPGGQGTYTTKGDILTIRINSSLKNSKAGKPQPITYQYSISGNTLTLGSTFFGSYGEQTFTKVK